MSTQNKVIAIVAMSHQRIIGNPDGELPWYIPEDFKHFKRETEGHPVVVGRKTFDEIVARLGKPLPGRFNSVVSKTPNDLFPKNQVEFSDNPEDALIRASRRATNGKVFVIGGASIYKRLLGLFDEVLITRVFIELSDGPEFPDFELLFDRKKIVKKTEAHDLEYQFEWWENPRHKR